MKHLLLVSLVALMPAVARADLITETTGPISQTVDSASNGSFTEVDLPAFDQSLGTLTGASIYVSATVSGTVIDYARPLQPPSTIAATVGLAFLSPNFAAFDNQIIQVSESNNQASVTASFSGCFAATSFVSFFFPDDNFFIPDPDIFIKSLAGSDTETTTTVDFDITESLTYTPIPEPGSLLLFASCLGVFVTTLRRHMPRRAAD